MDCPQWCTDEHPIPDLQHHTTDGAVVPSPSSLVIYGQQIDLLGAGEPASIRVTTTGSTSTGIDLPPATARDLSVILDDAAKGGMRGIRALSKALREISAEMEAE